MEESMESNDLLELLTDILAIDTQNPPGNEKNLAEFICAYLQGLPCHVQVQDLGMNRGNVIAIRKGKTAGNALLLNGHLDTVPYGDRESWNTPPETPTLKDGRIYARGASDMKSGLCAALYAFKRFCESGQVPEHDVIFAGTADEETGGLGAQALLDAGCLKEVTHIVIGEPTGNALGLCAKGTLWLRCAVQGRTSHAAYPQQGISAIQYAFMLAQAAAQCVEGHSHPLLGEATCTLTQIEGGVKVNMLPDACVITLDIRTTPDLPHAELLAAIRARASALMASAPGLDIAIEVFGDRMPISAPEDCLIAQKLEESYQHIKNEKIPYVGTAFFSDASIFLKTLKADAVLFGPGDSEEAHRPNESVSIEAVKQAAHVYEELLQRG